MNALIHRIITSILWFIILSSIFSSKLWCSMTKAWVWLRRREDGYKDRKLESRLRGSMAWLGSSLRGLMAWLESPLRGSMDWLGSLLRGTMAWLGFQLSSIMVWLKYARSGVFFFFFLISLRGIDQCDQIGEEIEMLWWQRLGWILRLKVRKQ